MRLICPNCGAQYEVADDVIPDGGRDVQCSNCSHTWFEQPGASVAAEMDVIIDPVPVSEPEFEPEPELEPEAEAEPEAEPEPVSETEAKPEQKPEPEPELESKPEPEPEKAGKKPRKMDPDVADILREEAEFEKAARQADSNTIETQPDLDLSHDPDDDRRSREARDRLARLRGEPDVTAAVTETIAQNADAPRRELLPDIEEINSTLRPDQPPSQPEYDDDIDTPSRRSGFKRGFMYAVIVALLALATYVFAPQISVAVPQTEPYLTSYVAWVDQLRIDLDRRLQGLIDGAGEPDAEPNPEG